MHKKIYKLLNKTIFGKLGNRENGEDWNGFQRHDKILQTNWLSAGPIWAFTGQFYDAPAVIEQLHLNLMNLEDNSTTFYPQKDKFSAFFLKFFFVVVNNWEQDLL